MDGKIRGLIGGYVKNYKISPSHALPLILSMMLSLSWYSFFLLMKKLSKAITLLPLLIIIMKKN